MLGRTFSENHLLSLFAWVGHTHGSASAALYQALTRAYKKLNTSLTRT